MSDRSGHSVYFSDDLRRRVDEWAENSNLSKADIYDEALRFFFEHHEIDAEGNVALTDEYRENLANSGESERELLEQVLENQEAMMGAIENEGVPDSGTSSQNKNSEQSYRDAAGGDGGDGYEHLRGRYDHDECIDPDDVRPGEIKQTRKHIVPIIVGVLNWKREEQDVETVEKSEFIEEMQITFDVSEQSVRNYIDEVLLPRNILIPHPSIHSDLIEVEEVHEAAASATDRREFVDIDVAEFGDLKQNRYCRSLDEYAGKFIPNWDRNVYYIDRDAYIEDVWEMIRVGTRNIAVCENGTHRPGNDRRNMNEKEWVWGATSVLNAVVETWASFVDVDESVVTNAVAFARKADDESGRRDWAEMWGEARETVNREVFGVSVDAGDMSEECASEMLGVDVDAGAGEIKQKWAEYVKENHPDAGGEMEADEFHEMMAAKDVLLD